MKRVQKEIILADHLPQVIRTRLGRKIWQFHCLASAWQEIVGEHIAARTRPAWIRENTLWLYVSAPAWSQEIQLIKPELLAKIQQAMPDTGIKDIRCLQEPARVAPETTRRDNSPPVEPEIKIKEKQIIRLTRTLPDARAGKALHAFWKKIHGIGE